MPSFATSAAIACPSGSTISSFSSSALSNAARTASSNQVSPGFSTWIVPNRYTVVSASLTTQSAGTAARNRRYMMGNPRAVAASLARPGPSRHRS